MAEKKKGKFGAMIASQGLGMLKNFGSALRRSPESRQCIDNKKAHLSMSFNNFGENP